ncbi:RTA1-domain-containing protein [Pluteus cervinus]|uniref:RTA1-domain-containing protein n=1 Tax=Pluteus cervinus TaxID=181527 RepID=A0ACD3B7W6_9AGAR|nr:RTA1-domain-containing protein [Pluteus cervinus]
MSGLPEISGIPPMPDIRKLSPYGYIPDTDVCILFLVLYSLSTFVHTGQAIRYRLWWLFPTVIWGGVGEILGWGGRLWSSHVDTVLLRMPFMIQVTATIVSPTFILAANFIIFGRIINLLGSGYSRLPSKLYSRIFLTCDVLSLGIQAVGGGMASAATTLEAGNRGGHVMLAGVVSQLCIITFYTILATEFLVRYALDRPFTNRTDSTPRSEMTQRTRIMLEALGFNTLCLVIRAIYRTVNLADGWGGRVMTTELYFNVLEGGMIVLSIYTFNFVHPGAFLPAGNREKIRDLELKKMGSEFTSPRNSTVEAPNR